jgi:cytochrome c553
VKNTRIAHLLMLSAFGVSLACGTPAPVAPPAGVSAADVEKLVNDKLNKPDTSLALWRIQPGLGTVMIEYANRLARLWRAGDAGNWDMAKYQHDEMLEIQEVAETTRPARSAALREFESMFLAAVDKAIAAKDRTAFATAMTATVGGCNTCHKVTSGANWLSYAYVSVQRPKMDPAYYIDWKGGGRDNYIANPPLSGSAGLGAPLSGVLDSAGLEQFINAKLNIVDRSLALGSIQKGLGTVMIEYGDRFSRMYFASKAANWDMAKYQRDEMTEIQEVAAHTRPARAPMLKAFEVRYFAALDNAIATRDAAAFDAAYAGAVLGCNACHAGSNGANWKSYDYITIQVPTGDNAAYMVWNAARRTGNYVAKPPPAPTPTVQAPVAGILDMAGVEKRVNDKLNAVDRSLVLWNIQPGLGTVMIEYGLRFGEIQRAIDAENFDLSKYQLDEMLEIQRVAETTRPARAPLLKGFENGALRVLNESILAKQKEKALAAWKSAAAACDACHVVSTGTNWSSYGFVQIQQPRTDPADYLRWNTGAANTGNYVRTP